MAKKLHLTVLCGGQSAEHEVSIMSASNVVAAIDENRYNITVIYITKEGQWHLIDDHKTFLEQGPQHLYRKTLTNEILVTLGYEQGQWVDKKNPEKRYPVDCVFPVLHGTLGEDGGPQGLFEMMNVPYVGADLTGSVLCMEKHISKQLLTMAGLPVVDWVLIREAEEKATTYEKLAATLGEIFFIKPANQGSSIGISKVRNQAQCIQAIKKAFQFDDKILAESYVIGRELECSVLGNEKPVASLPGELISRHEFYSYEAKYLDANGAEYIIPASLTEYQLKEIQSLAIKAFNALDCTGLARVDFFLQENKFFINELNTIPGFTEISLYPKNWDASGLSYDRLINDLIQLALERHQKQRRRLKAGMRDSESLVADTNRIERIE